MPSVTVPGKHIRQCQLAVPRERIRSDLVGRSGKGVGVGVAKQVHRSGAAAALLAGQRASRLVPGVLQAETGTPEDPEARQGIEHERAASSEGVHAGYGRVHAVRAL